MAAGGKVGRARLATAGAGLSLALVLGPLVPAGAAPLGADPCPDAVPTASVTRGMTGQGLTVTSGGTPEPFAVEVLGVLKDGIGAGRDMIIIKVSDLPGGHVVDQGGGIWAGMSGSPVYVDGKLLGAVSYGFTAAPSVLGGLTPASDMYDILDYQGVRAAKLERKPATKVKLSADVRRSLAARAGTAVPGGSLQQLPSPLAVSGVRANRFAELEKRLAKSGMTVRAYAAGSKAAPAAGAAPAAHPAPGGNFAAMLSYGDVTAGAIGTTTAVCGDHALAFGHPFDLTGPAHLGASDADALAIIKDDTFGSFKLANIGADFGTVDQDRVAGIRGDLTETPSTAPLNATITNSDTGKQRTGTTRVVDQDLLADLLLFHIWSNDDAVFDEWGDGVATSEWSITGRRADNSPFVVSRANRWASLGDVTVEPALDAAIAAYALQNNGVEDVTIDNVSFSSTLSTTFEQLHVSRVRVSVNGGAYKTVRKLVVKPGAKLKVRTYLSPYRSSTVAVTTTAKFTVPKAARGQRGSIQVAGGIDLADGCLAGCADNVEGSLDGVLAALNSAPRNDLVATSLSFGGGAPKVTRTSLQALTVTGSRAVAIRVRSK